MCTSVCLVSLWQSVRPTTLVECRTFGLCVKISNIPPTLVAQQESSDVRAETGGASMR